jgi:hypothetical protein
VAGRSGNDGFMRATPNQVREGQPPTLKKSTVEALPEDRELEMLREQRIRFDGYFSGPTW